MNKSRVTSTIRIILLAEVLVLLFNILAVMRDYQDSWILEGLEVPFAIFVITYLLYVFIEKKIEWIVSFAIMFRAVFSIIPDLKYPWFQGLAIDQQQAYGLVLSIYNTGHSSGGAAFERVYEYSGTPLMHLLVAMFSKLTLFSPIDSFKYVPFLLWFAYPLFVFVLMKRLAPFLGNSSTTKYAVIISSLPFDSITSYLVTGTTIGLILVFLFLSQFTKSVQTRRTRDLFLALVFGFALVIAHSFSSITLMIGILLTYAIFEVMKRKLKFRKPWISLSFVAFLLILVNVAWLLFYAQRLSEELTGVIAGFINTIRGVSSAPEATGIYPRFFSLSFINMTRIALLYYGSIMLLLSLMIIGMIIVVRRVQTSWPLMFLSVYVLSLGIFLVAQIALTQFRSGLLTYDRMPIEALVLSPIFVGIVLSYLDRNAGRLRRLATVTIIVLAMLLCIVQVYQPPQLVPPADSINKTLPSNEPIVDLNNVNTAYERYLIMFAVGHVETGAIASDENTANQFWGTGDYNFVYSNIAIHWSYYNPLSRLVDTNITRESFDYFLIHLPGKSGSITEKAEIRTDSLISDYVGNTSIIYDNGQSFMCTKPFLSFP